MGKWLRERFAEIDLGAEKDVLLADSLSVAKNLGIEYDSLSLLIKTHKESLEEIGDGKLRVEKVRINNAAKPTFVYWLTEAQCWYLLTLSKNTKKSEDLKLRLVKAFKQLKEKTDLKSVYSKQSKALTRETADYLFTMFPDGDFKNRLFKFRSMVNAQMRKENGIQGNQGKDWVWENNPDYLPRYMELERLAVLATTGRELGLDEHSKNIFVELLKKEEKEIDFKSISSEQEEASDEAE